MTRLFTHNDNGDVTITDSGTITVDTSLKWEGVDSIRPDTALAYRERTELTTLTQTQFQRMYVYMDSYPDSANSAIAVELNTAGSVVYRLYVTPTGTVRLVDSAGSFVGNISNPLNLDAWNILEVEFTQQAAGNGTIGNKVNGIIVNSATSAPLTNVAANRLRWGRPTTNTTWTAPPNFDAVVQNNNQGGAPDNTYPGGTIPPGVPAQLRPSGNERRPVIPCGSFDVNNVTLGLSGDRLGIRFVLDQAQTIYRHWFGYRMGGVNQLGNGSALTGTGAADITGTGYGGGNGGTLRFDLFAVGGDGKPTGSALFSETSINAVDRYNTIYTELGMSSGQHMLMYAQLDTSSLSAGAYILQIQNTNGTPTTHYSSVNCPVSSATAAGPHGSNTLSKNTSGAMMGLDPRECVMWSINAGTNWYWGQPVGGDTIADGISNGEHRDGSDSRYYTSTGDDEVRLPWFAIQATNGGQRETFQPYYGGNTDVTNQTLTCTNAGRAVTLTHAGAYAHSGQSVGTITVINLNTGQSRTCTPSGTGGKREAALNATLDVGAGETITIQCSGVVALENADTFQVLAFALGTGDNPFNTSSNGAARMAAYVLPWPYFAEPTAAGTNISITRAPKFYWRK